MPNSETDPDSQNLKILIKKRGQVKSTITRFKTFLDSLDENSNLTQLKLRLTKLDESWSDFKDIQDKIELLDDSLTHTVERETFEEQYFELIAQAHSFIESNQTSQNQNKPEPIINSSIHSSSIISPQVRLPSINLPSFEGNYEEWIPFADTFQSLIHNNETLTDIQKLHYLKSSLKGQAAQVIHSLETTSANYVVAWTLLEKRYKNLRLIVQKHVRSLFDLPSVDRESSTKLRQLIDGCLKHIRALEALDQPTQHWDTLIVHLITSKLCSSIYRDWELSTQPDELPTLKELTDFLQRRCTILENSSASSTTVSLNKPRSNLLPQVKPPVKQTFLTAQDPSCRYCGGSHAIFYCQSLLKAPQSERFKKLQSAGVCFNCLKPGHTSKQCRSSGCKKCNAKHNTVLHFSPQKVDSESIHQPKQVGIDNKPEAENNTFVRPKVTNPTESSNQTCASYTDGGKCHVLLSTALVDVTNATGAVIRCRALLDNGSQSCFITEKIAQHLKLFKNKENIQVKGIDQCSLQITGTTQASIKSLVSNFQTKLKFLVVPKITGALPSSTIDVKGLKIPENITLADPTFAHEGKIDILLGQEIFLDLLCIGQIKLPGSPTLQKTKLGWIVGGTIQMANSISPVLQCNYTSTERIDQQLRKFWTLEEPSNMIHLSSKEKYCEEHYIENTVRTPEGRYVVKMPLKSDISNLGDSKEMATKRFLQVEKRLQSDEHLRNEYVKFMQEYKDLCHMNEICNPSDSSEKDFFLPHHPVKNNASTTTKVRVVFDASAKSTSGVSLNDLQLVGPTIQRDVVSIILSFRMHNYVLIGDAEKMYRQVLIDESQRNLLKIVWRPDPDQPIKIYQLNTVTYGTASAAYLATRTLKQLAQDERERFPKAASVLENDFYVDDLMTGVETEEEAISLQKELTDLLASGGFNLRKWNSNSKKVLEQLPEQHVNTIPYQLYEEDFSVKTLGLWWDAKSDKFHFKYTAADWKASKVTKRTVLSYIARLFDPLGLVAPILVRAKLLLQELWKLKLTWDESFPLSLHTEWTQFLHCLEDLNCIRVPRQATLESSNGMYEIHAFADASELAYGGAVYLRHEDESGRVKASLICAKSKVAPIKTTSLPRLELCAALLVTELVKHVEKALCITWNSITYWTDSTIVLSWLKDEPARWPTFVANRVSKIQELTNNREWNHVSSMENPADLVSRGTTTKKLMTSNLWWQGPHWLSEDKTKWPKINPQCLHQDEMPECKPARSTNLILTEENNFQENAVCNLIARHSSFKKITRVLSWCLRFRRNSNSRKESTHTQILSLDEIHEAEKILIKFVQRQVFKPEIKSLSTGTACSSSKISSLDPFIDQDGIIRVGGRTKESDLQYDMKHQILLPKNHRITEMIAREEHLRQIHCGPQTLLYSLRQKYWIVNGRNVVRKITRNCLRCFKAKPISYDQKMGDLPAERINPARAFLHTGVDYCGPFLTKLSKRRNASSTKSYVAVFVCFTTKAVHLELVSDLTTEAFLAALRRFTSRRGKCSTIRSDNGKTFVGANRKLKELKEFLDAEEQNITVAATNENINWMFNPPYAPHMAGLCEAAVKSLKHHLVRIVGSALLTFEELSTILTQIEGVLNSRPLTPLSNSPKDLSVLTPSHFLIGSPLTAIPEPSMICVPESKLTRWQRLQYLYQHFWQRWSTEYLTNLQHRNKWQKTSTPLKIGDMVLVKDDRTTPLKWPLARVVNLHPGKDNLTRVVTVKTATSEIKRSINKLCHLPIDI